MKWRPMSKCPAGVNVLAIRPRDGRIVEGRRDDHPFCDDGYVIVDGDNGRWFAADWWMPKPKLPESIP